MFDNLTDEQRMFRDAFRRFLEVEVAPFHEEWERAGIVPREVWRKAGENGFLCPDVPEAYGGMGEPDFRFNAIIAAELAYRNFHGPGFPIHSDMVVPYLIKYGSEAQKASWLPGVVSGETIAAVAMTEPNTGSDLAGVQATAVRQGDYYVLSGQKTFISNGILADLVIVVAKTDPAAGSKGISLLAVERDMGGFVRGRNLDKVGMHAQDTAELYFQDVRVPVSHLIGEEGRGFYYLMSGLAQERLSIAVSAIAGATAAFDLTLAYCRERTAFGRSLGAFQNTKFKLAEMKTEVDIGQVFVDHCIAAHNAGELTAEKAAEAKWWTTELQRKVVDQGVQLHGGYGYMEEYPIARLFRDTRAQTIYGGTTEIMKEVVARGMGLR